MNSSPREKYILRLTELEALHRELEAGGRPGDGAVGVGLLLEAAGDVLRRKLALGVSESAVMTAVITSLRSIPQMALRSWGEGVEVTLATKLKRAASQAVEAVIPDSVEDGEAMAQWAVQDLQVRDRLESALVALEAMGPGRPDATALAVRLRRAVSGVDRASRTTVAALTALNGARRAEAALLDPEFRPRAWWYSERTGIDDDQLVKILGGEVRARYPLSSKYSAAVNRKRSRPVTSTAASISAWPAGEGGHPAPVGRRRSSLSLAAMAAAELSSKKRRGAKRPRPSLSPLSGRPLARDCGGAS